MVKRRFTVIMGGAGMAPEAGPWQVDLCRPGEVAPEAVAGWRALLTRTGAADPVFSDPDYLLTAARHLSDGRTVTVALVSAGEGARRPLHAAIPLTVPHPVWGKGRFAVWQPHGHAGAPALDPRFAGAIRAALLERLETLRRGASLDLASTGPTTVGPALRPVAEAVRIPAHHILAVGGAGASVRERIAEPHRIRDAVEEFLGLDAAHAAAPIIGDPCEATLVRVVTRLFAERRQCAVDLTRRDGQVVAASLILGTGLQAVVWRRAAEGMAGRRRLDRSA